MKKTERRPAQTIELSQEETLNQRTNNLVCNWYTRTLQNVVHHRDWRSTIEVHPVSISKINNSI